MATTSEQYINKMYDNQKKNTLSGLESAYKQNVSTFDNTAKQIPQQYYEQKRDVEGNAAIQRKNMNEVFNANGLNTGAVGQANLAMSNQKAANLSALNKAQATAQSNLALQRSNAEIEYKNAVQQAIAQNDYNRAKDLYSAYQQDEALRRDQEAKAKSEAQNQVDALLKIGVKPSSALVAQSGYSTEYVNGLYNAYIAQKQAASYSGGGGGSSSSKSSKDSSTYTPVANPKERPGAQSLQNYTVTSNAMARRSSNQGASTSKSSSTKWKPTTLTYMSSASRGK